MYPRRIAGQAQFAFGGVHVAQAGPDRCHEVRVPHPLVDQVVDGRGQDAEEQAVSDDAQPGALGPPVSEDADTQVGWGLQLLLDGDTHADRLVGPQEARDGVGDEELDPVEWVVGVWARVVLHDEHGVGRRIAHD